MTTILTEPISTLPLSPPASPTIPPVYHKRPPLDIFRPNPHPYPIKTTSTGILSRSNSTTKTNTSYQFYIPQSTGSPVKDSRSARGDKERRGGRHGYNSNINPTPLPVPEGFASAPAHRERRGSASSLSSVEKSGSANVFGGEGRGGETNNTYTVALGKRKHRPGTMPPSMAAAFEAPVSSSGLVRDGGDKRRGRTYHTVGRRSGGRVKGMVASFERSSSRSGNEDEDGDKETLVHQVELDYGHRRTRYRSDSLGSYSSASPGPPRSHGSEPNLKSDLHGPQEDFQAPRQDQPRELEPSAVPSSEELTIEQLLASFPFPNPVTTSRDDPPILNVETVKLRNAGSVYPRAIGVALVESTGPVVGEEELTVEQLLAQAAVRGKEGDVVAGGANAWESVAAAATAGCNIKRVREETVIETGSPGAVKLVVKDEGKKKRKKRLEDVFLPVGCKDEFKEKEEVDRQLRFEQDMSETKEMVRALSARVASVEARIGEMERAAGDLKVRGRKWMNENENEVIGGEGTTRSEDSAFQSVLGFARAVVCGALNRARARLASVSSSAAASASDASTETDFAAPAREVSKTRESNASMHMPWRQGSRTCYMLFLGLGACALTLRAVARRGSFLRGRLGLALDI